MSIKDTSELFDTCVKDAISIGRKYMRTDNCIEVPTREEWHLALVLFQEMLK